MNWVSDMYFNSSDDYLPDATPKAKPAGAERVLLASGDTSWQQSLWAQAGEHQAHHIWFTSQASTAAALGVEVDVRHFWGLQGLRTQPGSPRHPPSCAALCPWDGRATCWQSLCQTVSWSLPGLSVFQQARQPDRRPSHRA